MEHSIFISVFTSTATTALLFFVFRTVLKSKINHYFRTELEKYKSELHVTADFEKKMTTRRIEAYAYLVEVIYRTRNMARDLSIHFSLSNSSLFSEFKSRVKELEDCLYRYRIDLERDNLFIRVHEYKNLLLNFSLNNQKKRSIF